ncbi:hypothetical protein PQX77_008423 [Marasmius sp. AFHP31]|nr:hypothetical protein PQX77_013036 [Marasmius sp. AFHP31]KAK1228558.1 hypothetical protein PQX77_008423 [Marasmius sp. AFHP31]
MAFYAALTVSGNLKNNASTTIKSTNENVAMPPIVVAAPNVALNAAQRPRFECSSTAIMFDFQRQQRQEKKLRRTQVLTPSPAHNIVIEDKVNEYHGEIAELGFHQTTSTTTTFKLEDTDEYKWLMAEVATTEDDDHDDSLLNILNAFPQPPSFSASKSTDKRKKRHGVIFDFPKAQTGVDCGKWW